jgi:hypothetical protein
MFSISCLMTSIARPRLFPLPCMMSPSTLNMTCAPLVSELPLPTMRTTSPKSPLLRLSSSPPHHVIRVWTPTLPTFSRSSRFTCSRPCPITISPTESHLQWHYYQPRTVVGPRRMLLPSLALMPLNGLPPCSKRSTPCLLTALGPSSICLQVASWLTFCGFTK